jgi:hypothetical protein
MTHKEESTQTDELAKSAQAEGPIPLELKFGHDEIVIRRRYQVLSIANDFCIAVWFLIGSVFFLFASMQMPAAWLFIVGSAQFLARPAIRLARSIHLRQIPDSEWDY